MVQICSNVDVYDLHVCLRNMQNKTAYNTYIPSSRTINNKNIHSKMQDLCLISNFLVPKLSIITRDSSTGHANALSFGTKAFHCMLWNGVTDSDAFRCSFWLVLVLWRLPTRKFTIRVVFIARTMATYKKHPEQHQCLNSGKNWQLSKNSHLSKNW